MARLVDGVTKLGRIPWTADEGEGSGSRENAHQAENLRKMFLAMVDDIGVVLIKLADRLHNMRTLDALPPAKQSASLSRRWRSTRRWQTDSASGSSNPSSRISPSAILESGGYHAHDPCIRQARP